MSAKKHQAAVNRSALLVWPRREHVRWRALQCVDEARPEPLLDSMLLTVIRNELTDLSGRELRRELDYLRLRDLLTITSQSTDWLLRLTYQGIDYVEYTSADLPGISRPIP